ncbi:NAD(P)/FAD-dependent oxidoreductase [Conexibacter sp. SYSU D00693]|uniref:flavin-containing monooxygenase n=1 Tax=Conexibacter sp. SYSU D00693 TaxID=2812560 RepID=UPI00196AD757|nr:NAD(P)/FAD-dependent oxidoreductase [Conexibacter sp. SYSU D00693]
MSTQTEGRVTTTRVAIIGAGLSGIAAAVNLKDAGIDDFVLLERAGDVGGVWRDNTYPGAACDTPSHLYSFSFATNPGWRRSYGRQAQIHQYTREVVDRHGLRAHLRLDHEVLDASWDDDAQQWVVTTPGETVRARVLLDCAGPLVEPSLPAIEGLESFDGPMFHSARWDHDVALAGKRVAVIGTGASAVQFVPELQPNVERLLVFQRTAPWVSPKVDRHIGPVERRVLSAVPAIAKALRANQFAYREAAHYPVMRRKRAVAKTVEALTRAIMCIQVRDPELRRRLQPDFEVGCKRILMSNTWYSTLAKPNVDVVTERIERITPTGLRTADGVDHHVDAIVLGTGFHIFDAEIAHRVHGRDGRSLAEAWGDQPRVFRGTTVAGFPNMFRFASVGSGLGHGSMVWQMEAQAAYVVDALRTLDERGMASAEVRADAVDAYFDDVLEGLRTSVWMGGGCRSWYQDASGAPTVLWPKSMTEYRRMTRRFDAESYELRPAAVGAQREAVTA